MKWNLERYREDAYALLRIVSGFLFAFHGAQKSFGVFTDRLRPEFGTQAWLGGWIELLGGLAVGLGWQTSVAAFLCSGTMAVAYVQFHWKGQWGAEFFPAVNKGELAALYAFVFLYLSTQGDGRYSLGKGRGR